MMMRLWISGLLLVPFVAQAQQLPDAAKLAPIYQQQRNFEADKGAQCYAVAADLQARITELEKQLAEAKSAPK